MQDEAMSVNPEIPMLVGCVSPVSWTSANGPLDLTMPTAHPIVVNVTSNGAPVSGASVHVAGNLTSDSFDFLPGAQRTVPFIPGYSNRTTDANGSSDFMFYPSTGTTLTCRSPP
jgi:hypothetical protein